MPRYWRGCGGWVDTVDCRISFPVADLLHLAKCRAFFVRQRKRTKDARKAFRLVRGCAVPYSHIASTSGFRTGFSGTPEPSEDSPRRYPSALNRPARLPASCHRTDPGRYARHVPGSALAAILARIESGRRRGFATRVSGPRHKLATANRTRPHRRDSGRASVSRRRTREPAGGSDPGTTLGGSLAGHEQLADYEKLHQRLRELLWSGTNLRSHRRARQRRGFPCSIWNESLPQEERGTDAAKILPRGTQASVSPDTVTETR